MKKEIDSKYYIFMVILCGLFFACGYKVGDSSGYKDGYTEGYRYDCKDEIGTIYKQVKAQTKAIAFTDSSMKRILHENDSLKRKEYYQKRFQDSVAILNKFKIDSIKYASVVKAYNDSLSEALGLGYSTNFILHDGYVNLSICFAYKDIAECQDGFNIRKVLQTKIKKTRKKK